MRAKVGGQEVKAGYYWNLAEWAIVTVAGQAGGVLPGHEKDRYFRIPVLAVLLLAPVMGGLFVMFLPFIGFALLLWHGGDRAGRAATRRARALVTRLRRSRPAQADLLQGRDATAPLTEPANIHTPGNASDSGHEGTGSPRRAA